MKIFFYFFSSDRIPKFLIFFEIFFWLWTVDSKKTSLSKKLNFQKWTIVRNPLRSYLFFWLKYHYHILPFYKKRTMTKFFLNIFMVIKYYHNILLWWITCFFKHFLLSYYYHIHKLDITLCFLPYSKSYNKGYNFLLILYFFIYFYWLICITIIIYYYHKTKQTQIFYSNDYYHIDIYLNFFYTF